MAEKVGLITVDELMLAGNVHNPANNTNYLYNGSAYWTMSLNAYGAIFSYIGLRNYGVLVAADVSSSAGVRPVIALNATVKLSRGDGSTNNPYIVNAY